MSFKKKAQRENVQMDNKLPIPVETLLQKIGYLIIENDALKKALAEMQQKSNAVKNEKNNAGVDHD